MTVTLAHDIADGLFDEHGEAFGAALPGYRGHVHRVVEMVARHVELDENSATLLGVAGFFHDAGIWMDETFDYLPPSVERAREHLSALGVVDRESVELVEAIIDEHHRVRRARHQDPIVESFRRADLTDVSFGLVSMPATSRRQYRALHGLHPSAGFRRGLVRIAARWVLRHPLRPMPMIKL